MSTKTYVGTTDVAKLVRAHLKREFPAVKFSVRSKKYSGGCSIDIDWTDGPTSREVDAIGKLYQGASFDGMQDLKTYHDTWVRDDQGEPQSVHLCADFRLSRTAASRASGKPRSSPRSHASSAAT